MDCTDRIPNNPAYDALSIPLAEEKMAKLGLEGFELLNVSIYNKCYVLAIFRREAIPQTRTESEDRQLDSQL